MDEINKEIDKCLVVLRAGGMILYPTDTVWGIGCDATNEKAVDKIFALKRRDDSKSMIILLDHTARLRGYFNEVPQQAYEIMELSEQPVTLVLSGAKNVAKNMIAVDGSLGVRIVLDEFCRRLIGRFGKPIVSTSANISGQQTPVSFSSVSAEIISGVDHVVSLRQNEATESKPSTILKMGVGGEIKFIRR